MLFVRLCRLQVPRQLGLLVSMYWTLRTVHVQDHTPVRRAGHSSVHPLSVQSIQPFYVAVLGKHLGLEPAHGVGAGGWSFSVSPSNDDPHRRVLGQTFSVVGILVACQTTVHRLPEKATNRCCTLRPPRLSCRHSSAVSVSPSASSSSRQASSPASEVMVAPRNSNRIRRSKRSLALELVLSPIERPSVAGLRPASYNAQCRYPTTWSCR